MKRCTYVAVVLASMLWAGAAKADFIATAPLSGLNSVPQHPTGASGFAMVMFDSVLDQLTVDLTFTDLSAPVAAGHIHFGDVGVNGPVILPFAGLPGTTSGTYHTVLTAANLAPSAANGINTFADAIAAIEGGHTYVNLHNSIYPGGEIRGQLMATPEPATLGLALIALSGFWVGRRRLKSSRV